MGELQLRGLAKRFGTVQALCQTDLDIAAGQLICLLGPSGCGKTTLLRLIAGLEAPDQGQVLLDGKDLTATPAHQRNFGMVFQSLALFPHLNVADNIAYGLRLRGLDSVRCRQRVEELLALVQLPGVAARAINQLSGGQRQRVAIARALALEPHVFLLDEPLSALDAKLRETMQVELRLLQQRLGITTIVVTHDQREAMTMADQVVVMSQGEVQQVGAPLDIYRNPQTTFVADFIGTSNLIPITASGSDTVTLAGQTLRISSDTPLQNGQSVTLAIRPEEVHIWPLEHGTEQCLRGEVVFIRDVGASVETHIDCAGQRLIAVATPKERPAVAQGDTVAVELPVAACRVLPG